MSKEENMTLVRRFFDEVFSQGNPATSHEILTPDFSFYGPAAGIHGPANFLQFTRSMREGLALQFAIELEIYDGEKAATYTRMHVKHQGEFGGIAPSGQQFDVPRIDNFLFVDGKIREVKTVMDHEAFRSKLRG